MFSSLSSQPRGASNAWLEYIIFGLDRWLRQRQGVYEYTNNSSCIFRIQHAKADADLTLSDGTHIASGDTILNLHLWNEHMPDMGHGVSMGWARQVGRAIRDSLKELARHIEERDDLHNVIALRADMRLGTAEQTHQLKRIAAHLGFESAPIDHSTRYDPLHRLSENIYIFLLVLATNPIAIGTPILRRDHALFYLSRSALERHYRHKGQSAICTGEFRRC